MKTELFAGPTNSSEGAGFSTSKAALAAKNVKARFEKEGVAGLLQEQEVRDLLSAKKSLLIGGISADEVVAELKRAKMIVVPVEEKKAPPPPVKTATQFQKLAGTKSVEDVALQKQLEENKFFQELEREVFNNDKDLDAVYERAAGLGNESSMEKESYYMTFADEGLVPGGRAEVEKDLRDLKDRDNAFEQKNAALDPRQAHALEKNKKVATIVERAVAYSATDLGWYGDHVRITPTSHFDDVKRRIDEVLEIRQEESTDFVGLGIDATYRGLLSEKYKEKFTGLLDTIQKGWKNKIKYFTTSDGKRMPEFAVPKIILYFNVDEVKDLVQMVKNVDNEASREAFKKNPLRLAVLNQLMIQCDILGSFAKECGNDAAEEYAKAVAAIEAAAQKSEVIRQVLDARHEDDASRHMRYLVNEYKEKNGIGLVRKVV